MRAGEAGSYMRLLGATYATVGGCRRVLGAAGTGVVVAGGWARGARHWGVVAVGGF